MTREERDLHGLVANGSDHLTAYNIYAEAVNQHGYLGEVYGLPRHLFDEGLEEWAERRGVLIKAIEDTALGLASVYRSLDLPLPKQLPYASKDLRLTWMDLVARVMPFDLVIDEHTADGMEARVSKTSVAGSWGAVAGSLRFFADRFGIARASIEGTTLPYDLVSSYAAVGEPTVVLTGPRKHQRLALERRRRYFGFQLDTEMEQLNGRIPDRLRDEARDLLAGLLVSGDVVHPDAGASQARRGRARRAVAEIGGNPARPRARRGAPPRPSAAGSGGGLGGLPADSGGARSGGAGRPADPGAPRGAAGHGAAAGRRRAGGLRAPERGGSGPDSPPGRAGQAAEAR